MSNICSGHSREVVKVLRVVCKDRRRCSDARMLFTVYGYHGYVTVPVPSRPILSNLHLKFKYPSSKLPELTRLLPL